MSTRLVGRDAELSMVAGRLGGAAEGAPGVVVVAGDAGLGKTRLVREVAAQARDRGWTVLAGGCLELSEGATMLAPVAQVLRGLARDRGEAELARLLEGPARRLARLAPELDIDSDGLEGGSTGQMLVSFHRLLRTLADERPVLLVLEDLHWADATTRDLLQHLASRLDDERLLVLATVRTDDLDRRHPLRPVLAEIVRRPETRRIDLGPLDTPTLAAHLARLLGEGHGRDLLAIAERASGNPFFAEELLEAGVDGSLPPSLEEVLSLRLERLPPEAQQLLGEASVLGTNVDAALLASITGLDRPAAQSALRAALDDGVLLVDGEDYAFRHALLREVATQRLLPDQRIAVHAAAAAALEVDPDLAAAGRAGAHGQAAYHWWAARDVPRCLSASVVAAGEAERVFAGAVALRHLRRAIELWADVEDAEQLTSTTRAALLLNASRIAWEVDDPDVGELAALAVRAAHAAGDPRASAEATLLHSLVLSRFGHEQEALAVAARERARHDAENHTGEHAAAMALALLAHATAESRASEGMDGAWELDAVANNLRSALRLARTSGDLDVERTVLTGIIDTVGPYLRDLLDEAVAGLAALEPDGPSGGTVYGLAAYWAARNDYLCGHFAEVESAVTRWRAATSPTTDAQAHAWAVTAAVAIHAHAWAGRVDRALARVDEFDVRDYEGRHNTRLWLVWAAGDPLRWTGQVARALTHAEVAVSAEAAGYRRLWYIAELAASRAAAGASPRDLVVGAGETPASSVDRWRHLPNTSRAWPWAMARLVDAVASAADGRPLDGDLLEAVDSWAGRLERYVEWLRADAPIRSWATACLQRVRAQRAFLGGTPDPALWDPVVADFEDRGGRPYVAWARMRRAAAQAAANGAASPASSADLVAAWTAFDEMSMAVPRQEAIGLARALRVRLPGVDDDADDQQVLPTLTEREREVLALVAAGWSNPRVGEHLFISSKTVSVHLSNAMRKLGVASRTQAALIAQRAGLVPDAALPSSMPGLRSGAAAEA